MTFFQELTSNQTLMTGVTGWVVAQVLKTILDIGLNHSFNPERLVGSGGMPSSHSSTVSKSPGPSLISYQPVIQFLIFSSRCLPGKISRHAAVYDLVPLALLIIIDVFCIADAVEHLMCIVVSK